MVDERRKDPQINLKRKLTWSGIKDIATNTVTVAARRRTTCIHNVVTERHFNSKHGVDKKGDDEIEGTDCHSR
jgi:hypothetical protein